MNKTAAVLALALVAPVARAQPTRDAGRTALWNTAKANLEGNRFQVGSRRLLTAGKYQFHSMWTRDFAFASRGLLAMGDHRTVRDHLDTLLEHTGPDGLVPRALDTVPIGRRVVLGMIQHRLGLPSGKTRPGKLSAQILDEHAPRRSTPTSSSSRPRSITRRCPVTRSGSTVTCTSSSSCTATTTAGRPRRASCTSRPTRTGRTA